MDFTTDIRKFLISSFLALPVLLISYLGFLSAALANISTAFLFVGAAIVVPIILFFLHLEGYWEFLGLGVGGALLVGYFANMGWDFGNTSNLIPFLSVAVGFFVKYTGPFLITDPRAVKRKSFGFLPMGPPEDMNINPSLWASEMVFIFTYMFMSAYEIWKKPVTPGTQVHKVDARKQKATILMMMIPMMLVLFLLLRFSLGAESTLGLSVAVLMMGGFSAMWYNLANSLGADYSDIFGIVAKMVPTSALSDVPKVCVYQS
jgi:hypothetical protein